MNENSATVPFDEGRQLNLLLEREQPKAVRVPNRAPLARATDPATSREAIESLTRSGQRASINRVVLEFLRTSGPATFTYKEIAARLGLDAVDVMRRLNDLRHHSQVEKCGERACSTNGNKMTVWRSK